MERRGGIDHAGLMAVNRADRVHRIAEVARGGARRNQALDERVGGAAVAFREARDDVAADRRPRAALMFRRHRHLPRSAGREPRPTFVSAPHLYRTT